MWADLSVIVISILELFFLMKEQNDRVPLNSFHKTSKVSYSLFFVFGEKIVGCSKDNCNINLFDCLSCQNLIFSKF